MALKKKRYTLDELNAFKSAYGKPLERKELLISILKPFIIGFTLTYLIFYYWIVALLVGIVCAIYGYRVIMPVSLKRVYEGNAFTQKNLFVNGMTQLLTNPDRTINEALQTVVQRTEGEFKKDIYDLITTLTGQDNEKVREAFDLFAKKYKDDVIFEMFVEQLTTTALEGRTNIKTLKNINTLHNELKGKRNGFLQEKKKHEINYTLMIVIIIGLILTISFSFGWDTYVEAYAHSKFGWITSGLFLFVNAIFFNSFMTYQADDAVMEVKF